MSSYSWQQTDVNCRSKAACLETNYIHSRLLLLSYTIKKVSRSIFPPYAVFIVLMHCLTRAVTDGTIPRIEVTKRGNGSEKRYKGPEERKRYQLLHHGCDCSGPTSTVVLSCTHQIDRLQYRKRSRDVRVRVPSTIT